MANNVTLPNKKERCRCVEVPAFDTMFELSYYTGDDISATDPFLYGYELFVELRTILLAFRNNFPYGASNIERYFDELCGTIYRIARHNELKRTLIGRAVIEIDGNSFVGFGDYVRQGTTLCPLAVHVINKIIQECNNLEIKAFLMERYHPDVRHGDAMEL